MDNRYIKTDSNKIINEKCIKWVRKMEECLYVCTKSDGCLLPTTWNNNNTTHLICKNKSPESYEKLNTIFLNTKS